MTNTAHIHIARTRRLLAVTTAVVALGLGVTTVNSADAGTNPVPSPASNFGTPTATTMAPAN